MAPAIRGFMASPSMASPSWLPLHDFPNTSQDAARPAARLVTSTVAGGGRGEPSCGTIPSSGSGSAKPGVGPSGEPAAASTAAPSRPPPYSPVTALGAAIGGSAALPPQPHDRRPPAGEDAVAPPVEGARRLLAGLLIDTLARGATPGQGAEAVEQGVEERRHLVDRAGQGAAGAPAGHLAGGAAEG